MEPDPPRAPDLRDYLMRVGVIWLIACGSALALALFHHRTLALAIPFGSLLLSANMIAFRRLVSKAVARAVGTETGGGAGLGLKLIATLGLFWFTMKRLDPAGLVVGYVGSLLLFALSFVLRGERPDR